MSAKDLYKAQKSWESVTTEGPDGALDEKRQDRSYDPASEAERSSVSSKLNEDCGKMRGQYQVG